MSDLKLDIGPGATRIPGFTAVEIKDGSQGYPLEYPDCSAAEIRASHVLEHFSHRQTMDVLRDWARVLKPGGLLRIAVPDFDKVVEWYKDESKDAPLEGYLMGGQTDEHDYHRAIFNEKKLRAAFAAIGLTDVKPWTSEAQDCAALEVSLNLQATKPDGVAQVERAGYAVDHDGKLPMRVVAAMSVPRLGFMDNYFSTFSALVPLGINIRRHIGVFWGQCLERCMLQILDEGVDAVLTLDYDTLFKKEDVRELVRLLHEHPEADAIASLQASRFTGKPLMTIKDAQHQNETTFDRDHFAPDLTAVNTAHFGLTIIRASSLRELPHPWFKGEPAVDGTWSEAKTDPDIWFWRQWEKTGRKLFLANHVVIGHLELMGRWPDVNLECLYQHPSEFMDKGKPEGVWQ